MSEAIQVHAMSRNALGKGASRRLRRDNLVPAVIYGDNQDPQSIMVRHNELMKHLEHEGFYSQLLMVSVDEGQPVRSILRDLQRHPAKPRILHLDFQRVTAGQEMTLNVPLHYTGEEKCPGVKNENAIINHNDTEVAIACRPRDIPEFIEVDMSQMHLGDSVHLSDLVMPEGVRLLDLIEKGDDSDRSLASLVQPRVAVVEDAGEDEAEPDQPETDGDDAAPAAEED